MRRCFITFVVVFLGLVAGVWSAPYESEILQVTHRRMYFSIGEEENIYPDAGFVVMNGKDTIAIGTIEFSGPSISYSYPMDTMPDTSGMRVWIAIIDAAEIDSLSPITLGTTNYVPHDDTPLVTDAGAPVGIIPYSSPLAMQLDLETDKLDGCFSFSRYLSARGGLDIISSPAPYYCAIVPGISRHAQRNSMLTTALYYRFNEDKYSIVFEGDGVTPVTRLCLTDTALPRHYAFDPERGRTLGGELAKSVHNVSIAVSDNNLEKAALYFSDMLSRDRIRTTLADRDDRADCRLVFVPVNTKDPRTSLTYLYDLLVADTSAGESINQTVRIIGKYLELVQIASDSAQVSRFLNLAEQSLAEDIGVLPLFRPSVYFISQKNLKGGSFDSSGEFTIRNLVKINFPSQSIGTTP